MLLLAGLCLIMSAFYLTRTSQGEYPADLVREFPNLSVQVVDQMEIKDGKVVVDLYYEVLCPDSRSFVLYQLFPAWQGLRDIFTINYVPYGKAGTYNDKDRFRFSCQHGPVECQGNTYHACAAKYIEDEDIKLDYIKCMINDNYNPPRAALRCSREMTVPWSDISTCAKGREGNLLHKLAGDRTHALRPKVTFIPTIELNGEQLYQRDVRRYFSRELCKQYQDPVKPPHCISIV
eukprot:TRINITY_DN75980_c0_g1_i1.p1 TRINITY_DN75980_c0_g1~~TRINITY_DN75980_c0_g1_i1.p1  ORF type:complete len:234 (-),score=68.05 TRINITY_DN75980_c0_g1_i1:110-811(-)